MNFKIEVFSSFCWFFSVGLAVVLVASCGPVRIGGGGDDDDAASDDDDSASDDDDAVSNDDDTATDDDDAVSNDDDDSVPSGSCVDDAWEDNDSVATPSLLGPGTRSGLHACDGDEDYFSISLAAGDELTVNVLFSHVEGDIDAQLQNSAGSVVLESAYSTNDNETLGPYVAAFGGVVVLRVHLYSDAGGIEGNPYDLDVSIASSP